MRHLKVSVALILLAAFTLLTASCGTPITTATSGSMPEETTEITQYKQLEVDDYYVAIGYDDIIKKTRFIHFTGLSYNYCWWIQDKEQYCVGDIYTLSEEHKTQADGLKHVKGPWQKDVYGSYAKFEKIGNCEDLMTIKTLEVTDADFDELEGRINFKDTEPVFEGESGTYYYTYATFGVFDADLQSAKPGDIYIFAFPGKSRMIPLKKVEK